jgi:hypothetical protein
MFCCRNGLHIKTKTQKTLTFKNTPMNQLKRVLGLVWIALAMAAYFCIFTFGLPKFMSKQDDLVFGIIILLLTR